MKVVHSPRTKKADKVVNLLFYGDFNCTTGFGNVSKQLINSWSKNKNFNITILAINDSSEKPYNYKDNVMVLPCLAIDEKKDGYARLELLKILYSHDFDVFFALNDIEVLNSIREQLANVKKERVKANKKKTKYVLYTPIDSEPIQSDCEVLNLFDEVITYTEYAKAVLKPLISESIWKKIKVIPHGIDTEVFYPIENNDEISETKKLIFGRDDVFVFGSVNRNSARKDMATLMIGFAMFKHTSQADAVLYLHCNPKDRMGIDCFRLSERLGLELGKDIFFPHSSSFDENNEISESELNKIYNTFDCFITTTTAEGWGLTICEAMATKKLVVAPKHTSITEITDNGNNAFTFKFMQRAVFVNDAEKIRFISNPEEVAQVCGIVYNLQNEKEEVQGQRCFF
jgi:glycosyltransferase involved in cell wall biosynthesis